MPLEGRLLASLVQPKQTVEVTLATPREELLSTPEELPTSEPATSQIVYTIQESDLSILPSGAVCTYTALLYGAGKNAGGASATVYYRLLKNGASVQIGSSSVAAGYFYTVNCFNLCGVKVGDTVELRLWASAAGVNWDYKALAACPTRVKAWRDKQVLIDAGYSSTAFPTLTLGTPVVGAAQDPLPHNYDNPYSRSYNTKAGEAFVPGPVKSMVAVFYGDNSQSTVFQTHSTYRPLYFRNGVPTTFTFRRMPIIAP